MILFFIINGKPSAIEQNKNEMIFHKKHAFFLSNKMKPLIGKPFIIQWKTPVWFDLVDIFKKFFLQKIELKKLSAITVSCEWFYKIITVTNQAYVRYCIL